MLDIYFGLKALEMGLEALLQKQEKSNFPMVVDN
jgi:hypothetical protein